MTTFDYDLFVIGAGSGGIRAARVAAAHGARVAMAEEFRVGGTCVIRGCVPKKLLSYGARLAEEFEDAARFGWSGGERRFDWATLRDNVRAEVGRLGSLYVATLDRHGVALLHDRATLAGPHSVRIGDRLVTAERILIATGATPAWPDIPGARHGITSDEVFDLERLPATIAITGGGYIASELAGIFNSFGARVVQLVRGDRLLRDYDEDLSRRLRASYLEAGIDLRFGTSVREVERASDGRLTIRTTPGDFVAADVLLHAIGRRPNSGALGLEAAGIEMSAGGAINVDVENRTSIASVFAIGDVTDRIQLTPVAIREGQAFADRVFGGVSTEVEYDCVPTAVFSQPPIASAGLTEAQARLAFPSISIHEADFRPMKNAFTGRSARAYYKLVVDADTDRVLGAHLFGPEAPEIMQPLAIAVRAGLTKREFDRTVPIHPTMAEELVLLG